MKQFKAVTGNILSFAALAYLALIPAFHSLHLITCQHEQTAYSYYHQNSSLLYSPLSDVGVSLRCTERNASSETNTSLVITKTGHQASTCPICRLFFRLLHSWWLTKHLFNSSPWWNSVSGSCLAYYINPVWILLSGRLSRAPPHSH